MDLLFVCLHQKENEWLVVASSRSESSEIKYLMRLRFEEASLRHLFTNFARVSNKESGGPFARYIHSSLL